MKNAVRFQSLLPAIKPETTAKGPLIGLKIKDYSLLGLRDFKLEHMLRSQNQNFTPPRIYTLVSQNRKISINEDLGNRNRLFLNFESYKWCELYFDFFKDLTDTQTNSYIFKNIIYRVDTLIAHYYSACAVSCKALPGLVQNLVFSHSLDRMKAQFIFASYVLQHEHLEPLAIFYFYELFLISINQGHRTGCRTFITSAEAKLILGHFFSKKAFEFSHGKFIFNIAEIAFSLWDYVNHQGRILVASPSKNQIIDEILSEMEKQFNEKETLFDNKFFEAPFIHK